ncbi:nuclear transport factor 2 family protein [Spirosoma sp. KNUC1025]|uniref:nuclear transport factor 2 family protein n=1 Tax=Spirosoma sp. KNUC1025 TaxID=2894082 RepID=UPI00386FF005|nr:nuclear transport factor 2 family protein [Spirosoma sp. KNUC1025]
MTFPLFLPVLFLLIIPPYQPTNTLQADYEALVAAERGFAKAGLEKGIRDSFVENLDEQSVVYAGNQFRPGKATYERAPKGTEKLTWRPNYAEIAASGTLGFTTGPFEFRPKTMDEEPVAYGQFTSVWHKTASGDWKVLIDFGCTHPKPAKPGPDLNPPTRFSNKRMIASDTTVSNQELRQVEAAFVQTARTKNLRDAYRSVLPASDSIRLLREGYERYEGTAAKRLADRSTQPVDYQPLQLITSRSGDLGFCYGYATFNHKKNAYLRIWRKRSGRWQLAHEVLTVTFS